MKNPCAHCDKEKYCEEDCYLKRAYDYDRPPEPLDEITVNIWDTEEKLPTREDWVVAINSWGEVLQYYYRDGFRADDHRDSKVVMDIVAWLEIKIPREVLEYVESKRLMKAIDELLEEGRAYV